MIQLIICILLLTWSVAIDQNLWELFDLKVKSLAIFKDRMIKISKSTSSLSVWNHTIHRWNDTPDISISGVQIEIGSSTKWVIDNGNIE